MEKVLDIYKLPYDEKHPVVNMDESPVQLIGETREELPMKKGKEKIVDSEYVRNGVCDIFMAIEALAGKRIVKITETRTKKDWAIFIKEIAEKYPDAEKITLIMDNLNTHYAGSLYEVFKPEEAKYLADRFNFVYTPKHGSWLNIAEIELNVLKSQCLNRRIPELAIVRKEVESWQESRNNKEAKINWRFTNKEARIKLKRLYPSINN
jgi:hypothetical protein